MEFYLSHLVLNSLELGEMPLQLGTTIWDSEDFVSSLLSCKLFIYLGVPLHTKAWDSVK